MKIKNKELFLLVLLPVLGLGIIQAYAIGQVTVTGDVGQGANLLIVEDSTGADQFLIEIDGTLWTIDDITFDSGTSFTLTLGHALTADRTITFPDVTGDVVLETFANVFTQNQQIVNDGGQPFLSITGYSDVAGESPGFRGERARGNIGSEGAVQADDSIFAFAARAWDGDSFELGGQLRFQATELWDGSGRGTQALFRVVPNDSTTITTVLTLEQDLNATFAGNIDMNGNTIFVDGAGTSGLRATADDDIELFVAGGAPTTARLVGANFELDAGGFGAIWKSLSTQNAEDSLISRYAGVGHDTADAEVFYSEIVTFIRNPVAGSEDGSIQHSVLQDGTRTLYFELDGNVTNGEISFKKNLNMTSNDIFFDNTQGILLRDSEDTFDYSFVLTSAEEFEFSSTDPDDGLISLNLLNSDTSLDDGDLVSVWRGKATTTGAGATLRDFGQVRMTATTTDDATRSAEIAFGLPVVGAFDVDFLVMNGVTSEIIPGPGVDLNMTGNKIIDKLRENLSKEKLFTCGSAISQVTNTPPKTTVDGTNFDYLRCDYDTSTTETLIWEYVMPDNFDGTAVVNATIHFTVTGTAGVCWDIAFLGRVSDEVIDSAFGSNSGACDSATVTGDLEEAKIDDIASGTHGLVAGDTTFIRLQRDHADGTDTNTADAGFISFNLEWN